MRTIFVIIFLSAGLFSIAQINPTKDTNKYADPQNMDVVYTAEAKCTIGEDMMYKPRPCSGDQHTCLCLW